MLTLLLFTAIVTTYFMMKHDAQDAELAPARKTDIRQRRRQ
jgi:hypothetical protein